MTETDNLRDKLVEGYVLQGNTPEVSATFVDAAFAAHEQIEATRASIVTEVALGLNNPALFQSFLMLVAQLEILHLRAIIHNVAGQLGIPPEATLQ